MTLPEHPCTRIQELERSLDQAWHDAQTFRDRVRKRIIQAHKDGDICLGGMNGGLRDLGLPEYVPGFTGTVTLSVEVCVTGTENEDIARQWAQEALVISSQDSDVRVDDIDRDTHGFEETDEVDQ